MARKTFLNGYPLPASDLNTYLMDQTVQTYADATARTAALPTPTEGQMSYLADQNTAYVYDGSSWNAVVDAKNYGATLPNGAAGKNKIINGGFDIWQRGTTFAHTNSLIYGADRWGVYRAAFATGASSSRQLTGLTGYQYGIRVQRDSGNTGTGSVRLTQALETNASLPLAGQTVTLSFYARKGANYSDTVGNLQAAIYTGTGTDQTLWAGFTGATALVSSNAVLTTSWQRFSITGIAGTSATQMGIEFNYTPVGTAGAADYFEVTGVQLEAGSVATPFSRAGGTIQGELAACQRYYYRFNPLNAAAITGLQAISTTSAAGTLTYFPVTMRSAPTANLSAVGHFGILNSTGGAILPITSVNFLGCDVHKGAISPVVASGLTAGQAAYLWSNNSAAYAEFNSEL